MFSIENPPDPPCSCKISGLKSDERATGKLAFQAADLLKSGLAHSNQFPIFSIRDYVLTARGKDIETNWPFPHQYLQLCSKHGIKDLLPPFEPPDSVRNRCFRRGVGSDRPVVQVDGRKSILPSEENVGCLDGDSKGIKYESCQKTDQSVLGSSDQARSPSQEQDKFTADPIDTNLCRLSRLPDLDRADKEGEVPSTVTSNAASERDSVPTIRLPCSAEEATTTLSETSIELEVAGPPCESQKTENTIEPSGKKCRLILKLSTISDPSHTEDIASNTTTIAEPMASKVCPVCKTFSSSSNTTLNAHIDQCLAVESTSKWTVNTKLIKHRVKPRKKRLMVDICATAPPCTLEELDRRNGSNWATDSSLPTAQTKVCAEGKRQRLSIVDLEDIGDESAVYFDSNGTKLRILSKFNDVSLPTMGENSRPRNHMKDGKESKIFSTGMKRPLGVKHSKYLKPKPLNRKLCCLKPDRAEVQIHETPETNYGMDKSSEKEESQSQVLKACDQINSSEAGTLRQWVCSKRTGLSKKFNGKDGCQGLGYPSPMTADPSIESNQFYLGNSSVDRSCFLKFPNPSENPISSPKCKRVEGPSSAQITDSKKSQKPPGSNLNQLTNGSTVSMRGGRMLKLSTSSGNYASSSRSKRIEVHAGAVENSDSLPKTTMNPSESYLFLEKGKKLSTSKKNGSLVGQSFSNSKSNKNKNCLALKKSRMHRSITEMGEQVPSYVDEQYDWMHDSIQNLSGSLNQIRVPHKSDGSDDIMRPESEEIMDEVSVGRSGLLKSRKERKTLSTLEREVPASLGSSHSGPEVCGLDPAAIVDSRVGVHFHQLHCSDNFTDKSDGPQTAVEDIPLHEDPVLKHSTREAGGGPITRSCESLVSEFHKTANPSDTQSNSSRSIEDHKRLVCGTESRMGFMEQCLCEDQEICCADEIGYMTIGQNTHLASEVDCRVGGNSFSEVQYTGCGTDPLCIPGPPGSFLPSPGDMDSEVLQENSSLTSSKILSSRDQHIVVDRESSGSPVSATSNISHPPTARSESKYSEPELSVGLPAFQDKFNSGFSDSSTESLVGDATRFQCMVSTEGAERINLHRESPRTTTASPAEGTVKFTDDEPCCCSRKESIPLGASLSYQDSQVLRQRTVAPAILPPKGKQITYNPSTRLEVFTSPTACPSSRINEMAVPMFQSPKNPMSMKASPDAAQKFSSYGDSSSASPSSQVHHPQSTSNPILRLMGKNLMVINKDEDASVQLGPHPPGAPSDCPNSKYLTFLGFSTGNISNQDCLSFYHTSPEGSVVFSQDPCNPPPPCFDVDLLNSFRRHSNSKTYRTPEEPPAGNCNSVHLGSFAGSSLPPHGLKGRNDLRNHQKRPISRPISPFAYNVERFVAAQHHQQRNPVSAAQAAVNPMQEVIVIDDSPENEADSIIINAKYTEGSRGRQPSPTGILRPTASNPNLRQMNAFSCYPSPNPFLPREPAVETKPNFLVPSPGGANTSPVKWGDTSQSSGVLLRSPFMGTSSSSGVF